MESGKKSLEELTTAGVFHVPEYQRYYSWTEPEWDDLWTDLYTLPLDKQHYFGTIIIQKTDETESGGSTGGYGSSREKPINLLIDGQQRLTSLALLVRSMTECLEEIAPETDHEGEILNASKRCARRFSLRTTSTSSSYSTRFVLLALRQNTGGAVRRVIHGDASELPDSPFEEPNSNGTERSEVGSILSRLQNVGLAEQNKHTWSPTDEALTVEIST